MPYALTDEGLSIPDLAETLSSLLAAFKDPDEGFGVEADVTPDSPLYKIAAPQARQVVLVWHALRDLSAQFDPQQAFGLQLDRLGSLIGLPRLPATRSTIVGRVSGTPGTSVSAGSIGRYKPGSSLWQVTDTTTITASGTALVELFALDFGAVDAPQAGPGDWQIVSGQVPGWDALESTEQAALGRLVETDEAYQLRFAEAARGLASYDAIVRALRAVQNVSAVYLYINLDMVYSPALQLGPHEMRPVITGGSRPAIIQALHDTIGAPVRTIGAVTGSVSPGNGQVLDYAFDRLTRRRAYLRLTYWGGNPLVPLENTDENEAKVLAAVSTVPAVGGQPLLPFLYGTAGAAALPAGSVVKMMAEGRLDPGDPWLEDAIPVGLAEIPSVSPLPVAAEAVADFEDPIFFAQGTIFEIEVDGGILQTATMTVSGETSAALAQQLNAQILGITADAIDGRLTVRSDTVGATSSVNIVGGLASYSVFIDTDLPKLFEGTDGDVTVVLVP